MQICFFIIKRPRFETMKLEPGYPEAHYFLASSYFFTNRYKEVFISINESIQFAPINAEANYLVGQIYRKLGPWNKAIPQLQTAMRIKPELPSNKYKRSDYRKSLQN